MRKYNFRVTNDKEQTPRGGLYKRGHYDLVIFNPEFIKNHKLDVVSGKNYQKLQSIIPKLTIEPLIWTCEIIYFPKNGKLPENAVKIIEQDTLKVKATLDYKIMENKTFCKTGSVHVFTGFPQVKTASLQQEIETLTKKHRIEITLTTA